MDLVFVRSDLLDLDLPETVLGQPFEKAWRSFFRPLARRALITAGVDNRVPFILAPDGTIDTQLSGVLRTFTGQTSGRTTMSSYGLHAVRLIRFLSERGIDLASVKTSDLSHYKRIRMGSGIEPISWNSEAAALKSFFDAVVLEDIRSDNPCTSPLLTWYNRGAQVSDKAPDFITLEQFELFRDEGLAVGRYGLRNVAFANFLLTTAARLDEGNGFKLSELPKREVMRGTPSKNLPYRIDREVAKGSKSRSVKVSKTALDSMHIYNDLLREDQIDRAMHAEKYDKPPNEFWLNQEGLPMGEIGWGDVFRRATKRTGIKVTPKTLRHTAAVYILSSLIKKTLPQTDVKREIENYRGASTEKIYESIFGDPLRKVQRYLGHASYETTFTYLDILGSHQGLDDRDLDVFDRVIGTEEDYGDVAF